MDSAGQAGGERKGPIDFNALWRDYHDQVYHRLYRMVGNAEDAKDLTICVYARAWQRQDRYDPSRSSVCTWLNLIVKTVGVGFWRKRRLPVRSLETLPVSREPVDDGPEAEHDVEAVRTRLWRAVGDLPELESAVMRLRHLEGLSVPETARRLGVCVRTVMYREARAKVLLQVKLRQE